MEDLKAWKQISRHLETFGEYVVYGFRYRSEDGELAWHTMSYPNENPIHDFWIFNGEFHAMTMHFFYKMTPETRVSIGGIVSNIDPAEKSALLEAIAKWESEDANQACT